MKNSIQELWLWAIKIAVTEKCEWPADIILARAQSPNRSGAQNGAATSTDTRTHMHLLQVINSCALLCSAPLCPTHANLSPTGLPCPQRFRSENSAADSALQSRSVLRVIRLLTCTAQVAPIPKPRRPRSLAAIDCPLHRPPSLPSPFPSLESLPLNPFPFPPPLPAPRLPQRRFAHPLAARHPLRFQIRSCPNW